MGKQFMNPYLKNTQYKKKKKRAGRMDQDIGPEFKPQYCQKKKKKTFLCCKILFLKQITEQHVLFDLTKEKSLYACVCVHVHV
jgi:hypothetical protein